MDLNYSAEELAFRDEVRGWLRENLPADLRDKVVNYRDKVSRVEVELMALEITNLRFLDQMRRSKQPPGADVSMLKIKGTEIQQALTELMMQAIGPLAQPFTPTDGRNDFDEFNALLAPRYCNMRKTTIYAGSNEIQRNIISKTTLGP